MSPSTCPTRRPTPREELDELVEIATTIGALTEPRVADLVAKLSASLSGTDR